MLPVTQEMAREYIALFVNRRAFAQQSNKPGGNGKHYYFRPKIREIERWAWDQARRVSGKSRPDPDLMTMFYEERVHDLNLSNEFASLDVNEICKHLRASKLSTCSQSIPKLKAEVGSNRRRLPGRLYRPPAPEVRVTQG